MSNNDNERTILLAGNTQPRYLFQSSVIRRRQRRLRQFQCCVCAILLCAVVFVLVVLVAYGIDQDINDLQPDNVTIPNNTALLLTLTWPLSDRKQKSACMKDYHDWQEGLAFGQKALSERDEMEVNFPTLLTDSPSYRHQKSFIRSNRSRQLSRVEYVKESAQQYLLKHGNKTSISKNCESWDFNNNNNSVICDEFQKFRNFDGTCNNLHHPYTFGVAFTPFRRALPPDYADGISVPRISKAGEKLPSARAISLEIHRPIYKNDNKFTVMLAVWGQFIDHDITATALTQGKDGNTISCCSEQYHPECYPVEIPIDDPYYGIRNINCLEFVRSAAVTSTGDFGPRQQLNQATSFLDGSVVYGSSVNISNKLRTFQDGQLKMLITSNNKTLLPISTDQTDGCNREEQNKIGRYCFMTGDQRANENLYLTSMHVIWARQHNHLAGQLKDVNPHWSDESIFQESRKILAAQLQHITYNEFLKILFGPNLMKNSDLNPEVAGYYTGYDSNLDPSIANSFAAAAFRFGHTLIPALTKFLKNDKSDPEYMEFHKMLFNPYSLYQEDGLDNSLKGAMNTTIEASDTYFNTEVKNHLFERTTENLTSTALCGLDLVSLNIQRGRDHGIPSYSKWRRHCGLKRPRRFNELVGEIEDDSLTRMQLTYRHVDDIDLYTGAISEKPLQGGILGPTFTCLIMDQFVRLKRGDRMWYENPGHPQGFTIEQLEQIRRTSLANVICDNSDKVERVQHRVMERVGEGNEYIPCKELARPDLTKWKDADLPRIHISDNSISVETTNVTHSSE